MPRNGHVSLYTDRSLATAALQARVLFHRGQGLHAFSRPSDGRFASIADRISLPLFPVSLTAPQEQQDGLWHALEVFSGMPTRWTASPEISWRVVVPSRRKMVLLVRVPFSNEVKPGFSQESRILVNGAETQVRIVNRSLEAEVEIGGSLSVEVTLRTPDLFSPSELRNSPDGRRLGLAIPCGEARPGARSHVLDQLQGVMDQLPEAKRGFVLLPRRWVAERSFAWATQCRRLVKDYERYASTLAGLHIVAFACFTLKRVATLAAGS